jgi:hypothetical protein
MIIPIETRVLFPYNFTAETDKDSNFSLFIQILDLLLNC